MHSTNIDNDSNTKPIIKIMYLVTMVNIYLRLKLI